MLLIQLPHGFLLTKIEAEDDSDTTQILGGLEENTTTENGVLEQIVIDEPEINTPDVTEEDVDIISENSSESVTMLNESSTMLFEESNIESYAFTISELNASTDNDVTTITISSAEDFIKLSHCDPSSYQNATLNITITGSTSLTGTFDVGGTNYVFVGLGSESYPFSGSISGQQISITLNRALFRALSSDASFNNNTILWSSIESKPMLADVYKFVGNNNTVLNHVIIKVNSDVDNVAAGSLFGEICGDNGTLTIGNVIDYSGVTVNIVEDGNAGLICNTLTNGKVVVSDNFKAPSQYSVTANNGHAGGLVGEMKAGTEVELNTHLSTLSVTAENDAGGIVGHAVNATVSATGTVENMSVISNNSNAGGIAGYIEYKSDYSSTDISLNSVKIANLSIKATNSAGGMFGVLKLDAKMRARLNLNHNITVKQIDGSCNNYGGLIGYVDGAAGGDTVAILSIDGAGPDDDTYTINTESKNNNSSEGGVIGCIGGSTAPVTVFAKNLIVDEKNPGVTFSENSEAWFGGIVGTISKNSVLSVLDNLTIATQNEIQYGGGIVGNMLSGSVLSLSGTTNLNGIQYNVSENVGQLVGKQDSSLIFAKGSGNDAGWTYVRSSQKPKLDDIGNYGQVIRLKSDADSTASALSYNLFNVQPLQDGVSNKDAGKLVIKAYGSTGKAYGSTGLAISSEDDFALLSVLWQTHGIINAVNTLDYSNLNNATITLSNNINLTGTGITGLTRDIKETDSVFSGTLDGNNHTITLSIGEAYGCFTDTNGSSVNATSGDDGNGRIYRHNALGIFASSNGTVSNLIIEGNIDVESYSSECYVGGIAGLIEGGTFTVSNVTASEVINCSNATNKAVYVGGLYGAINSTTSIAFGDDSNPVTSSAVIRVGRVHDGKYICLGGLIGAVLNGDNTSILVMQNVLLNASGTNTINLDGRAITDGQSFFAGGLIGVLAPYNSGKTKKITINKVVVNGYAIETNNTSGNNSICGGLLGSLWANTEVDFSSASDAFALSVFDGRNIANSVQYFGGLVYAASGKWTINEKGIDLSGAYFSASQANSFGLLVHDAYGGVTPILGSTINRGGLYIELTSHWDKAYVLADENKKISTTVKDGAIFDEFAAYTGVDILKSESNGIISLHTNDDEGKLIMNGSKINTYTNRSELGVAKQINSKSRYYYNLDRMFTEVNGFGSNNKIDTNAELMLWSVIRYCAPNLRNYFTVNDANYSASVIGGDSDTQKVEFDLRGYSYYPIDLVNTNLTVNNAIFKFYNEEIENGENANFNKNTSSETQHKGMHCGLFRNYFRQGTEVSTIKSYQLNVNNLELFGTIGMVDSKSGALLCGKVEGNNTNGNNVFTVSASNVVLSGLQVREMARNSKPAYAPLLIAESSSYSTLSLNRVSAIGYTENKKAATSLIGNAGSSTATQVNLSFSEMSLPSEKNTSIFTNAVFLESFEYGEDGIGTATYNFTKADQTNNFVTFGAEIDNTKEYLGLQLWYYDDDGSRKDANLVTDRSIIASKDETVSNFGKKYLQYVYKQFNTSNHNYHEIKINHRIVDILTGCGTYADPYVITKGEELETIAAYLQTGAPRKNWRVTITANQNEICDRNKGDNSEHNLDAVYMCDGSKWVLDMQNAPLGALPEIDNNTILYYLLSAYYDIQGDDIVLEDFVGLGNKTYVFRGVVTSTNNKSITLKGSNTSHGLIPYSYGSVIQNLIINYQKDELGNGITINSTAKDAFAPSAFFGGVFGVIMGGDNIIDNVTVNMDDGFLMLTGDNPHLIQAGGYVGSISGGGVIFRNMNGKVGMSDSWLNQTQAWKPSVGEKKYQSLYVNPFVGRVLDGFAFSENCTVNNTDKNYKINNLGGTNRNDSGKLISNESIKGGTMLGNGAGGSILTIKDSVGLLVFSALLNSGASAGPAFGSQRGTSAYAGDNITYNGRYQFGNAQFGKVRCAAYDNIGNPNDAEKDFAISLNDDRIAPGLQDNGGDKVQNRLNATNANVNLCYLAARFGDKYSMFAAVSNISDIRYIFTDNTYDMTIYGNGYQGIGCRYKANAGNNLAADSANYDRVVPWIRYVKGNGAIIKAKINVREYADDDFWTMGVGALFGYSNFRNDSSLTENDRKAVSDITISDSILSLKYYNKGGSDNTSSDNTSGYSARKAGVGGLSGAQVGGYSVGTVYNVQIIDTTIDGGYHAGGIFGSVGKVTYSAGATGEHFVNSGDAKSAVNFINCGFDNVDLKGYNYCGGFAGEIFTKDGVTNEITNATANHVTTQGQNSSTSLIQTFGENANDGDSIHQISAGGLIGRYQSGTNGELQVNNNTFTGVSISAYGKAAGLIGWIQNAKLSINNTTIDGLNTAQIAATNCYEGTGVNYSAVGGIIGRSQNSKVLLSSCQVKNTQIGSGVEIAVGGLIGDSAVTNPSLETFDCLVENCNIQAGSINNKTSYAGGIAGIVGNTWSGSNILQNKNAITINTVPGAKTYSGLLAGRFLETSFPNMSQLIKVKLAGVSIQGLTPEQHEMKDVGNYDQVKGICYIAYADYNETPVQDANLLSATATSPYVVTSPSSTMSLRKDGSLYKLFGDGASWKENSGVFETKAEIIWSDKDNKNSTAFRYSRTGLTSFDFSKRFAKYSDNQKDLSDGFAYDFPVLLVSADNTQVIADYLNLLTNGGYSQALSVAPDSVLVDISRYVWNGTDNCFDYSAEKPSLRIESDGTFVVTKEYDNDMNRFTLLTVKFQETSQIGSSIHEYVIHIPIIVRRVVEIDFTATLSYGTNLNAQAYDTLKYHVLDSFGNTISGYLTYRYNSAYGVNVNYGWQNFVDEGGDIAQIMEKTLVFDQINAFPSGTQLTLVDCSSGIAYYKTLDEGVKEVSMTEFKTDENYAYCSKTIGEILTVSVFDEPQVDGKFIKVDSSGKPIGSTSSETFDKPTVYVNGNYYRLPKADGTENSLDKYKVTIDESQPMENYFIIITIPQSESEAVNGKLTTKLGGSIAHHLNYKLRNKNSNENFIDNHENTASTYLISKGYQQTMEETLRSKGINQTTQKVNGIDRTLHVSVRSEILFPNGQVYQNYDSLYQAFIANMQTYIHDGNKTEATTIPSQTGGKVCFYVTDENGNYYNLNNGTWQSSGTTKESATSYPWTSNGDSMELLFSTDGTIENMIDLQGMRDLIRNNKTVGDSKFYIEAVLEAVVPAAGIDIIPESTIDNGSPENFTTLTYISRLSTQKEGISYSNTKSSLQNTQIKYYREKTQDNQLVYDADNIDQLGINLNDLVDDYMNQDSTCSRIETTSWLNLVGVRNLEEVLKKSYGVKYTLSLVRKGEDNEYLENNVNNANSYIQLSPVLPDERYDSTNNAWSWIVKRDEYMDGDTIKIGSVFDGTAFIEKITVWVRVDNVELLNHFYSNYKLELTAEIIDKNGNVLIGPLSDYLVYTLTKIKPEFVDKPIANPPHN